MGGTISSYPAKSLQKSPKRPEMTQVRNLWGAAIRVNGPGNRAQNACTVPCFATLDLDRAPMRI
jgi:hypothetical protein